LLEVLFDYGDLPSQGAPYVAVSQAEEVTAQCLGEALEVEGREK
jgi:hypothetical protein